MLVAIFLFIVFLILWNETEKGSEDKGLYFCMVTCGIGCILWILKIGGLI